MSGVPATTVFGARDLQGLVSQQELREEQGDEWAKATPYRVRKSNS